MSKTKKKFDEFYEKPSKHRSWAERGEAPVITRDMSSDEIRDFARVLAQSFTGATPEDIKFEFERIIDENDEDRTDCIWLRYSIKCINERGEPGVKNIYNVKIPIPERLRARSGAAGGGGGAGPAPTPKRAPARARALPAPAAATPMRHPNAPGGGGGGGGSITTPGLPAYNPPPTMQTRRRHQ